METLPAIGARAELVRTISDADIQAFAALSGDHNPVHLDDDYARGTVFGGRIAHGMLTAMLFSTLLARDLPGPGTIYLGQTLQFRAPVRPGDTITASVEVIAVRAEKGIVTLRTDAVNQDGVLVITGEATAKAP